MRVILTDIEGTTTPIAFVRDVLFPYARARLPDFVTQPDPPPELATALAAVAAAAPGQPPAHTLLGWMDQDAKIAPLKTIQGMIWRAGYATGALRGALYPDVAPALRRWRAAGHRLAVYSSGSVESQRLLFAHAGEGDLAALFDRFFDTATGAKRAPASYRAIAAALAVDPATVLFLSDLEPELDAAAASGLPTCQLVRPHDATIASARHPTAADFAAVERAWHAA